MKKTVVITQSNYIPWRGYFDLIRRADELILLDGVQFTRRDWRNRNTIKTPDGARWLTVPVQTKGGFHQSVDETRVSATDWAEAHIRTIDANYRKAAGYGAVAPWLHEALRTAGREPMLSDLNRSLLEAVLAKLNIQLPIRFCREVLPAAQLKTLDPTDRLVSLSKAAGASCYLSGPAAKAYLETDKFTRHGVEVAWMQYGPYPEYRQCWGAFVDQLSIVDLLLNCGADSANYLAKSS
jgi:hypothetical protein